MDGGLGKTVYCEGFTFFDGFRCHNFRNSNTLIAPPRTTIVVLTLLLNGKVDAICAAAAGGPSNVAIIVKSMDWFC